MELAQHLVNQERLYWEIYPYWKIQISGVCNGCFGTLKDINVHLKEDEEAREKINEKLKLLGDYEYKGLINVRHIAEFLLIANF